MKKFLLLLLLIPSLVYGAAGDVANINGKAITAVSTIAGKANADILTIAGKPCSDGDAACTPSYGSELATGANASDDLGGNEADATTGWSSTGLATFDSINTAAQSGTYHLTFVADSSADNGYRGLTGTANNLYKISTYVRHNGTASASGEWRCYIAGSAADTQMYVTPVLTTANNTYAEYIKLFYLNARQDTFVCQERNAANDGGVYVDNFSYTDVTQVCLGDELLTTADASTTDANDITMWTNTGSGTLTSATATPTPPAGQTYVAKFAAAADGDRFYIDLGSTLSVGTEYFLSYQYIAVSGDAFLCGLSGGTTSAFTVDKAEWVLGAAADTTWVQAGFSFTYETASHRYFKCLEFGSNNNATFAIDKLSIKEVISK
jgi:hypothetical protein